MKCTCGSETFFVDFRTTARMTMHQGEPAAVTYGPIDQIQAFATVTCAKCVAHLDIDNAVMPPVNPKPLTQAREFANLCLTGVPALTVKARPSRLTVPPSEALDRVPRDDE